MPDVRPDPKPVSEGGGIGQAKRPKGARRRGRIRATRSEWAAIVAAKRGPCRVCSTWGGDRIPEYHHLVARAHGGDDVEDNIVPLCFVCHDGITEGDKGSRRILAEVLSDAEYAYVVGKLGEGGMQRLFGVERP